MKDILLKTSMLIVLSILSCTEKDTWKSDVIKILNQQNNLGFEANRKKESDLYNLIYNSDGANQFEYLQPSTSFFLEGVKHFSQVVSNAIQSTNKEDLAGLYGQYQMLQKSYKKMLTQNILDSITITKFVDITNDFINLDKSAFNRKYVIINDSMNSKLRLLFLQSDAITCEYIFIDCIMAAISSSNCGFHRVSLNHYLTELKSNFDNCLKLTAFLIQFE